MVTSALDLIMPLADWTTWRPLAEAARAAPALPGVYLARSGPSGPLLYVGLAGESQSSEPGLRGSLTIHARGTGAVSGLREAALDRALADAEFVRRRLSEVENGVPTRTRNWAKAAIKWMNIHVCWSSRPDAQSAIDFEDELITRLRDQNV